jgi:hypothetical protein
MNRSQVDQVLEQLALAGSVATRPPVGQLELHDPTVGSTSNGRVGSLPAASDGRFITSSRSREMRQRDRDCRGMDHVVDSPDVPADEARRLEELNTRTAVPKRLRKVCPRRSSERELEIRDCSG